MSLISKWFSTTLVKDTDSQNTPEVNLQDAFEAIEIDIPTIETAEVQIKGSNASGGTFDLIGQEEPIPSSTGGFRTTVPLGGKYQFIKVYLSAAQTSNRVFAVRGISYASAGLVTLIDRIKNMRIDIGDIEVNTADIEDGIDELKVLVGAVAASPTQYTVNERLKVLDASVQALLTTAGLVAASPTENTMQERLKVLETSVDALGTILGAVTASPTENTVNERLKAVETAIVAVDTLIGAIGASPTENTMMDRLKEVEDGIDEVKVLVGEVQDTPTTYTLLKRLKDLLTGITLAANTGVDIGDVDVLSTAITKTIQTELNIIAAVAADAQDKSSELALTNMKKVAIFIDHARDATGAFVDAGTEYRVEVSEKATGNDTWRTIASAVCGIAAALGHVMDAEEAAGQTLIEIGATTPLVNDIQFFKNATIGNSEWGKIVAVVDGVSFTLQDGLTNTQAAITTYSQGEHFVLLLDVEAYTRLRVICNNNNGSTNQNIVWRCAE